MSRVDEGEKNPLSEISVYSGDLKINSSSASENSIAAYKVS